MPTSGLGGGEELGVFEGEVALDGVGGVDEGADAGALGDEGEEIGLAIPPKLGAGDADEGAEVLGGHGVAVPGRFLGGGLGGHG